MTEENSNTKEATVESTQATPGQQLKRGRESMGLTQQQVADRLHLRLGNIQDIETDTHKPGVSITFTKGYVRIYAKLLSMPVDPLLAAFDILHQGEKQPAKLQSFSQRVAKQANDDRWMMVTYLIVFLVIASLVIWWYQQSDKSIMNRLNLFSDTTTEQGQSNNIDEGQSVNAMSNNLTMPDELAIPEEDIKNQNEPTNVSDSIVDKAASDIKEVAVSGANQSQALAQQGTAAIEQVVDELPDIDNADDDLSSADGQNINGYMVNSDGTVDVVFTFKEDCWLSVTDANDEVMAVGVKVKGRVMSVKGVPPISVNMCPPNIVDIAFGGAPVDLSKYPRGIPVKFELSVKGE
jgi:cytoskeleton protein RodZ